MTYVDLDVSEFTFMSFCVNRQNSSKLFFFVCLCVCFLGFWLCFWLFIGKFFFFRFFSSFFFYNRNLSSNRCNGWSNQSDSEQKYRLIASPGLQSYLGCIFLKQHGGGQGDTNVHVLRM